MQQRLLSGTYECSLDNRFRLAIPARVRAPFSAEGAMVGWWFDECAIVAPRAEWQGLVERTFGPMNHLDDDQREMLRWVLGGAYEQELDKQGRVMLPPDLREHAGIESRAKVVGTGEYLEIWQPERLAECLAEFRREGVSVRAKRLADRIR